MSLNRISGTERKIGSGRKKNSFSFTKKTLNELNKMFPNGEIEIPIGRLWASQFFKDVEAKPASEIIHNPVIINESGGGITVGTTIENKEVKPQFVDLNE